MPTNRKRSRAAPNAPAAAAPKRSRAAPAKKTAPKGKKALAAAAAAAAHANSMHIAKQTELMSKKKSSSSKDDGFGEKKKKKKKKKKSEKKEPAPKKLPKRDPGAAKPAITAYLFFSNEKREGIKREDPNIQFGAVSSKLAGMWRTLSPQEKSVYDSMHASDVERYKREMYGYVPAEGYTPDGNLIGNNVRQTQAQKRLKAKQADEDLRKKKTRDPDAPAPVTTAYLFFSNEKRGVMRENDPEITFGDLSRMVSRAWSELADEEKQRYVQMNEQDQERYKIEMEQYVPADGSGYGPDGQMLKELADKKKRLQKAGPAKPFRDPAAPKQNIAAFLHFSKEARARIEESNPDGSIHFAQKSTLVGQQWKALAQRSKQRYVSLAAKDKERYDDDMTRYVPSEGYNEKGFLIVPLITSDDENDSDDGEGGKKKKKKKKEDDGKKKKDPNVPKPAATAYMLWSKIRREELKNEGLGFAQMSSRLGQDWKTVPDHAKQPFQERAAEDKVRFQMEMENYKLNKPESDDSSSDDSSSEEEEEEEKTKKKKTKRKRDPNEPKPPQNAYVIWSRERRPVLKESGLNHLQIGSRLGEEWNQHNEQEKEIYRQIANQDKERYNIEMAIWKRDRPQESEESGSDEE